MNLMTVVLAQLAPEPTGDVFLWLLQMGKEVVTSFQSGQHGAAVAGLLMVAVYALRSLLKGRVSQAALPWLSAGLGVLSAVAMQLSALAVGAQPMDWLSALAQGALAGATASGLWSLLGKQAMALLEKLLPKKTPEA